MLLNILGFIIMGFVILFTILFFIVCIFDKIMEDQFKLEGNNEWDSRNK